MSKATPETILGKALRAELQKLGKSFDDLSLKDRILSKYNSVKNLKEKARDDQDWEAQSCLSTAYEYGVPELNIEKDLNTAIGWLESSIRNGNHLFCEKCHLGALYDSRGTIADQRRAFELYLESACAGLVQGKVNVAEVYRCGIEGVVNRDLEEAFKWFRRAAGEEAADLGNEIDSPELFLKSTLESFGIDFKIDALRKLNKYYMTGDCPEGEPQPIKALFYLKKAAELGDAEAQKDLGLSYLKGESGHPKDMDKAKRWLNKAASNGDQEAEEILKKIDEQNIVEKVVHEPDESVRKSGAQQYFELLKMTVEQRLQRHPYTLENSKEIDGEEFEQFPKSPTAQHYKKACDLLRKGLKEVKNGFQSDVTPSTDEPSLETGIKMLAQGMLYENSFVISTLQDKSHSAIVSWIQKWIFKKLKINPNFFEGLVVLFATYPFNRRFSAESCKMDLRRTMFLNNIIYLIKKAEPDMPPTEDPYSYDQNYSSWLHQLYYLLGSNYIIAECFKDGAKVFQKALDCCPTFAEVKLPLGSCLLEMSLRKKHLHDECPTEKDQAQSNPDELLLERFEEPKYNRIEKNDYETWTTVQLRQKAKQLFMEYLNEVPECDKKYPEGHYHLAYFYLIEKNLEEAVKWKEKGEDAEEKRLPFMPPLESALKEQLRILDMFTPTANKPSKKNSKERSHVPAEKRSFSSSRGRQRQQDMAAGKERFQATALTCTECNKKADNLMGCPCKKASYCGRECQKANWKEHKKDCTSKKKK